MPDDTMLRAVEKMAEPIKMPFGLYTGMCPRKQVLHEGAH